MALLFTKTNANGAAMAVWRIEETEADLLVKVRFTADMEKQLSVISCAEKRLEWLASRILLQLLAGDSATVKYNVNGKPFFENNLSNVSISHTKGFASVVVSSSDFVGVDMEHHSERIMRIASRFIHPSEKEFIPLENSVLYHLIIWCAKETLYKMANCPGLLFKEDMIINEFSPVCEEKLACCMRINDCWHNFNLFYEVYEEYCIVWHW